MKERPILFNTEMVQAILKGCKTQARRVLKNQPAWVDTPEGSISSSGWTYQDPKKKVTLRHWNERESFVQELSKYCPLGCVGDRLWVRETFTQGYDSTLLKSEGDDIDAVSIIYKADGAEIYRECPKEVAENWGDWSCDGEGDPVFKPSIHMPRWASRLLLEITAVRVERLNDISKADANKEGGPKGHPSIDKVSIGLGFKDWPRSWFAQTWAWIYGADSWAANPWVWVIEFKVVEPTDKA